VEVAQKHQIHPMTLYSWGKALQQGAQSFLDGKRPKKDATPPQELEEETGKLKKRWRARPRKLMLLKK